MIDTNRSQQNMHQFSSPPLDQRKGAQESIQSRGGESTGGMFAAINGNGSVQSRRPPIHGNQNVKYAAV